MCMGLKVKVRGQGYGQGVSSKCGQWYLEPQSVTVFLVIVLIDSIV